MKKEYRIDERKARLEQRKKTAGVRERKYEEKNKIMNKLMKVEKKLEIKKKEEKMC